MSEQAWVREVGLRDGPQMVKTTLATERKLAWLRGAVAAGVPELEITSFVPPSTPAATSVIGALRDAARGGLKGASRRHDLAGSQIANLIASNIQQSLEPA